MENNRERERERDKSSVATGALFFHQFYIRSTSQLYFSATKITGREINKILSLYTRQQLGATASGIRIGKKFSCTALPNTHT